MEASVSGAPARAVDCIDILGVRVDNITQAEALDRIEGFIGDGRIHQVATVNPEFVVIAQEDHEFRAILAGADLALPDGVGLLLASHILGTPLRERVAGSDLVYPLAQRAAQRGHRVFLLGAAPGIAGMAARRLQDLYPGLIVAGAYAGSAGPEGDEEAVSRIRAVSPQVLLVAYGAPAQDRWIHRNRARLEVPVCIGVGGALDFISGKIPRAPVWMRQVGIEWLFRLFQEPWRWRRMLRLPRFVYLVLRKRLCKNA